MDPYQTLQNQGRTPEWRGAQVGVLSDLSPQRPRGGYMRNQGARNRGHPRRRSGTHHGPNIGPGVGQLPPQASNLLDRQRQAGATSSPHGLPTVVGPSSSQLSGALPSSLNPLSSSSFHSQRTAFVVSHVLEDSYDNGAPASRTQPQIPKAQESTTFSLFARPVQRAVEPPTGFGPRLLRSFSNPPPHPRAQPDPERTFNQLLQRLSSDLQSPPKRRSTPPTLPFWSPSEPPMFAASPAAPSHSLFSKPLEHHNSAPLLNELVGGTPPVQNTRRLWERGFQPPKAKTVHPPPPQPIRQLQPSQQFAVGGAVSSTVWPQLPSRAEPPPLFASDTSNRFTDEHTRERGGRPKKNRQPSAHAWKVLEEGLGRIVPSLFTCDWTEVDKLRERVRLRLETMIRREWPEARLFLFGSSVTRLCSGSTDVDMDLCVRINEHLFEAEYEERKTADASSTEEATHRAVVLAVETDGETPESRSRKKGVTMHGFIVEKLTAVFEQYPDLISDVVSLPRARTPIVKFCDVGSGIACDIGVNNILGVANSKLVRCYSDIDDRFAQLALLVKRWAKARKINDPFRGTLSSYAYVLMVINFMQTRSPPVVPCLQNYGTPQQRGVGKHTINGFDCSFFSNTEQLRGRGQNRESLAQLLVEFMCYWAHEHDYRGSVVSVRTGRLLTKEEKMWTESKGRDRHHVSIEDPFEHSHDLGRVCDRKALYEIRKEFMRAHRILCSTGDVDDVFKKAVHSFRENS